jgi:hypothetical protein
MGNISGIDKVAARHVAALERENRILRAQLHFIADLAGVRGELEQIRRQADLANPASPVPDPPEEGPSETTEEALAPDTNADANRPGAEAGSLTRVPAEQVTTPMTPGVEIQTPPASNLVSVTAPVQGTNPSQDGGVPIEQRRIETDVRVNPNPLAAEGPGIGGVGNDGTAFPWLLNAGDGQPIQQAASLRPPANAQEASGLRTMSSIRLARMRVQAGLAQGDELTVGQLIERDSSLTQPMINREIEILSKVAQRPAAAPMRRQAAARPAPSLAPNLAPVYASASSASSEADDLADLFLGA